MVRNLFESRILPKSRRKNPRATDRVMQGSHQPRMEALESRQVLAAFTAGNLVVERIGNGATVLGSAAIDVAVQEFSPAGTAVQTIAFGSTTGAADLLTDSGSSTSNGYFNAYNGFVSVPGYNSAAGTASVSSLNNKLNAVLGADGVAASRTLFPTGGAAATPPSPFSGNNYRSSIATSATTFYASGNGSGTPATGGVWYYDGSAFTQVSSIATGQPTNLRNVEIYGGQLYSASSSSTGYGIFAVGTGQPTAAGQASSLVINTAGSGTGNASPYGFVLFDTDSNGAVDLAYIADDRTTAGGGLQKWSLSGSTWTSSWSLLVNATNALSATAATGFSGLRGLTGSYSGGVATLYATTNETSNNRVIQITDNGTTPTTATAVATAGVNYVFRGLDVFTAASSTPSIVGAATAAAFATTYGTASAAQSFNVAGSNLSADLVATAPAGFEVSSDGTTYGSTATFARSGSSASGTLRVRLAATAAVSGSYNAQNIVLSSTGATSVNIVTAASGNTVAAKGLTIAGLSAQDKNFDGTATVTVSGTPAYDGLANGETFSVTDTVTWAFADATVGTGKTLVRTGTYGTPSGNYTLTQPVLTASILATAPAAPTINAITPGSGQLSVAFSPPVSNGGVAISGYEYSTDGGATFIPAGATSSPIVITGLTNGTTYDVQLRAVNSVGSGSASGTVQGTPAVSASPAITVTGLSGTFSTTYGTPSAAQSFTVSGAALVADLTVSAPTGLEVSTTLGSGYADSLALTPSAGAVASTTIYVRLKATAAAGAYNSRSISATSSGATAQTVNTDVAGNIVSPKAVTISGLSAASRTYDQTTTVSVTGTPEYSGLANGETFAVSGTVTWALADKNAGTAKPLVRTGDYQAPSSNYTVTQPALTAAIAAATLTTSGATAQSRVYNGTTTATITGATLVGVISGDDVAIATSTGTFASANVGTAIVVVGGLTLGGVDVANYSVTQPTGLAADITKAVQTIAFGPFGPQVVGASVTATASSGLAVTYTVSDSSVASITGGSVTLNAVGGITVTASQAGDSNYEAATTVTRTFKVIANAATTLAAGDIAVIGYDTGGSPTDNFSILVLKDLGPGTIFYVNDNEVTTGGSSFTDAGEAEATFTVLPGQVVAAGSVINLPWGNAAVSDQRFTWAGHTTGGLGGSNEELFVYTGTSATALTPTAFIYGVKIGTSTQGVPAGLVDGVTFIAPSQARARYLTAGAVYAGTPSDLRAAIGDTFNNWETAATNTGWIASSAWNFSLPAVQAITFDALASRVYGDASFELVATASSGLPVTFASSDPTIASVSGTTVTILRAGTVTITASQAGDTSYEAASSVARSLVISPKSITVAADAKSKVYGDADPTFTYQVTGLVGADALSGSLARAPGANVGTYAIGQGSLGGSNYAISFTSADLTVAAKTLTVTASNVNKPFGTTLTGGPGSTSFTSVGLVAGETIGAVTVAYGTGAASNAAVGTYTGAVTVSDATGGTFLPSNYSIGYVAGNIVVSNDPTISIGGSIGAMSTTYGTASAASAFSVSGGFLTGSLSVTAPAGFEVSAVEGSGYGSTVTLSPTSGTLAATTVYVRIAATTAAGSLLGNVTVAGGGATSQVVAIASSSMAQKALTIGGLSAPSRVYDGSTAGAVTGTPTYVGLVNGETFSVSSTVSWSFASKDAGVGKSLTASGAYAAPSANYTVTQPTFSADITAKSLTVTGAAATSKAYDGTTVAAITGATLVGVVAGDSVTFTSSGGTFASAGVGTGVAVTAGLVLGGTDSGNYSLTQPTGLLADITTRALTIAARNAYKAKGETLTSGPGSLAFASTGLQNGETIGSVTIAYGVAGGATGTGATVGTYAGQVSVSAATGGTFTPSNYAITYQGAAITVLNDIVVERLGDGSTVLSGNAFGIAVLEVSAGGTAIETIVSPFEGANLLTESGNSTSNGHLNTYAGLIAVPGLNTALGTTNGTSAVSGLNVKATNILNGASTTVAGRVTFPTDGTIYGTNNFRSVIATGANTFYATGNGSGSTGGVWYYDGTAFTRVSGTVNNTRNIEIFNGDLYFSTGSGSHGIYQVGSAGLPTTADTVATRVIPVTDPYGFSISPDGNTAFVSSTTSGLVKFTKSGGVWSQAYVVNPAFTRGLYVDFTGPEAVLFATTSDVEADPANLTNPDFNLGNNKLVRIVDTGAGSTATEILTAGTSYVFRGVDYAPAATSSSATIGTSGTLAGLSTVYGSASATTSITVTGSGLTGDITATAPAGFQVSSDGTSFGGTATFTQSSGAVNGTLTVRLAATTAVGTYSGDVTLASSGASSVNAATTSSTVTPAQLTVTANDFSRLYGAANPTFTATITGYVNGENASVLSGAPSLTTAATTTSGIGSYTIVAAAGTLAASNYTFSSVDGTLTVLPAGTPVKVSGVYARGSAWNATYLALSPFTTVGSDALGWALVDGANQVAASSSLTWSNIDTISLQFNQPISQPAAAALKLVLGDSQGDQTITPSSAPTLLAGGTIAQWTVPALANGKYVISCPSSGISDAAGTTVLDGDWTTGTSTFAQGSGDGTAGGTFNFFFNVLVADVNGSGVVNNTDTTSVRNQLFAAVSASNFRNDFNGSNSINNTDVTALRNKLFSALTAFSSPTAPDAVLPSITSPSATSVGSTSATLGATVTSDGGEVVLERGVVLAVTGTNADPAIGGTGTTKIVATGSTGLFNVLASGLLSSTNYSFKAYVRTSKGVSYTSVGTFTTA